MARDVRVPRPFGTSGILMSEDGRVSIGKTFPGTSNPWCLAYPVGLGGGMDERRFPTQKAALEYLNQPHWGGSKWVVRYGRSK